MWEKIIDYFARRHLLTNFITIGIFIGGIFFWITTPKEELPNMEMNFVHIATAYSGASPEEVEHFITDPIEDEIQGVDGIYKVYSTSSQGASSIFVEIEDNVDSLSEVVNDIEDAVNRVDLPSEVRDDPYVRQFKTSQKAIIDIAMVHTGKELLDDAARRELQQYVLALEQQLLNLSEVNSIDKDGYLKQELQVRAKPDKLLQYNISLSTIMNVLEAAHVRQPAGNIEDRDESKVTLRAELDTVDKLKEQIIRGGFEGQEIRLKQLANVVDSFEDSTAITKVNGHEGIMLKVTKSSSSGIIKAIDAVKATVTQFKKNSLKNKPMQIYFLDDESRAVRERLSLVGMNGAIGFVLILITLFIFLNLRAGFWVAMGIPFSFCFTMVIAFFLDYTINNVTLSAVIIVMGMIVDDAIVVAENITRLKSEGHDDQDAAVKGTAYVFLPIVASIVTTCVAFLPMLMFSGRMAKFIAVIPVIISLMLVGSLVESVLILPSHMNLHLPRWLRIVLSCGISLACEKYFQHKEKKRKSRQKENHHIIKDEYTHWFHAVEDWYGNILEKVLIHKYMLFLVFVGLLVLSGYLFVNSMKFVMFPNEETTEVTVQAEAPEGTKRYQTAVLARQVEVIFSAYLDKEVIGYTTSIAQSRHGGAVEENKFIIEIELVSREERDRPLAVLKKEWQQKMDTVRGLNKIRFIEHRFGQSSGSTLEIMIQQNNDVIRKKVVDALYAEMLTYPVLTNVEIDRPMMTPEYNIDLKRDIINRLSITPSDVGRTLRAILEGTILYELLGDEDDIDVRMTAMDNKKTSLSQVLQFPVENSSDYLVPLKDIVTVERKVTPYAIRREDYKRITWLYADLKGQEKKKQKKQNPQQEKPANEHIPKMTPVEVAEYLESTVFPKIIAQYPTTMISFSGEVKDTRESSGDFTFGVLVVVFLIYAVLALLFNSMLKPFIIMLTIPFGIVGVILAFWLHNIAFFGFFAAVGILGLFGVVVNDSIVMIVKLEKEYDLHQHKEFSSAQISGIAKTRLRAVLLTTFTTVAGLLPTAYGIAGYDSMLAEMMFSMAWGLFFATFITLFLVPAVYAVSKHIDHFFHDATDSHSVKS